MGKSFFSRILLRHKISGKEGKVDHNSFSSSKYVHKEEILRRKGTKKFSRQGRLVSLSQSIKQQDSKFEKIISYQ